jgi:transcriptional regulator with XRE-family HTH domain
MSPVNPVAIGRVLRALRQKRRWRQLDLAAKVHIGQQAVSRVELGDLEAVSVETLTKLLTAVGANLTLQVTWRGGSLDRLLDATHADLVERAAHLLRDAGWQVFVEVSFAEFAERGSIDILAWHPRARIVLVVEVKSEITAVEETLRRHDAKVRLAPKIAFKRFGERPIHVARLLVLPDGSTSRRRLEAHATTFGAAYPARGPSVRRWLEHPDGTMAGLLLIRPGRRARPQRRVRAA